ncbi:flagellar export chaperone FliS [Bradyrhizobium sp. U87765 SZCCT0131]|uniref:flagellar export chaperone FliS n=1 Tax=unclassified Bradyrhizobium TaxID=2631580 RepID=UPI001BA858CB|nr:MULTISPECIES: flagellar export chaperone FliS [unclassified Bradyrhizobium]MBR1220955.1 flagellar export chaperone FliS [Bradyrhizobium sp. U87765 SZCCT0131]MBR1260225.1 flagellar export chaperone FliS [Bradyrhizobium sp. U87765 SZCCT0134]MBR1307526.1 flagellar export chaperone FliS [Bradyrhizobium sp. U87765 SZCCT0110]MBR1321480.1 flagellar export chaperone FliS [Bradyrhizobium sp. U87765 SZCCT0109]MBR1349793.1 flagellar export chaperone FliS [Bradyrhizobium sp. U87765 SZCCT0048]
MTQNLNAYRANQAYRGAAVTVAPLTAVVMLFDGVIMFLKRAVEASEAGRFEEGHAHLMKATAILRGLSHHLNMQKGGALAERLFKTYNSIIVASHRAYGRPDAGRLYQKLIKALTELRDAWKSVAAQTAGSSPRSNRA